MGSDLHRSNLSSHWLQSTADLARWPCSEGERQLSLYFSLNVVAAGSQFELGAGGIETQLAQQ